MWPGATPNGTQINKNATLGVLGGPVGASRLHERRKGLFVHSFGLSDALSGAFWEPSGAQEGRQNFNFLHQIEINGYKSRFRRGTETGSKIESKSDAEID